MVCKCRQTVLPSCIFCPSLGTCGLYPRENQVQNPGQAWALGVSGGPSEWGVSPPLAPLKLAPFPGLATSTDGSGITTCCPRWGSGSLPAPGRCGRAAQAAHCPPCVLCELGSHGSLAARGPRLLSWSVSWSIRGVSAPPDSVLKNLKFTGALEKEFGEHACSFALLTLCRIPVLSLVC